MSTSSDEHIAAELAEILMRQALDGGPLARIRDLTRLLRILRIVARVITARRDREAYAITALWPYRKAASYVRVNSSTMQRWTEAGAKVPAQIDSARPGVGDLD